MPQKSVSLLGGSLLRRSKMFIALRSLVIPLRQERHVIEHVKTHCAPLERGGNWKPEAINIVLLRSNSLRKQI